MKISLIFPRLKHASGDPPLGIAYIASALKNEGFDVSIIDSTFNRNIGFILSSINKINPDAIGIFIDTTMHDGAVKISKAIRKNKKNTMLIAGGPHATIMPETLTRHFDAVVIGEGEKTFPDILKNKDNLKIVDGIAYSEKGKIIKNPPREFIKDLDSTGFPSLELLDMESYMKNWHYLDSINPKLKGTSIITSRGCPYNCTYCQPTLRTMFGKKIRKRSVDNVIDEMVYLNKKYKIRSFFFHDDTFTSDIPWVKEFSKKLADKKLNFYWGCNTRINTINKDLLRLMRKAGLKMLHVGVESGSQRIINDIYKKGIKLKDVKKVIDDARKEKVHTMCFFMIGAPTETLEEINKTIRFAYSLKCNEATFSITNPIPGTTLHDIVKSRGYKMKKNFSEYDYYSKRAFYDPKLPIKKLKYLQKKALFLFYIHPYRWSYVIKHITSLEGMKKMMLKISRFF